MCAKIMLKIDITKLFRKIIFDFVIFPNCLIK